MNYFSNFGVILHSFQSLKTEFNVTEAALIGVGNCFSFSKHMMRLLLRNDLQLPSGCNLSTSYTLVLTMSSMEIECCAHYKTTLLSAVPTSPLCQTSTA